MKYLALLAVFLVLFVACDAQEIQEELAEQEETQQREEVILEDQVVYEDEEITIEIENDSIQVDAAGAAELEAVTADITDWCTPGSAYDFTNDERFAEAEIEASATIIGVTTHNGETACELLHEMETYGMTIKTQYFINEDISTLYLYIDAAGHVTESVVQLA
ncbi:MAG: hypothetical protein ACMXYD_05315 [Candidatus Woesearchaeota archaeon]